VTFYEFDSSSYVGYNGLTGEVPQGFQDSDNFILTGMFKLKNIIMRSYYVRHVLVSKDLFCYISVGTNLTNMAAPSLLPSFAPSSNPTLSIKPSILSSVIPSTLPSSAPSYGPFSVPSLKPSFHPSSSPSQSFLPSLMPTSFPVFISAIQSSTFLGIYHAHYAIDGNTNQNLTQAFMSHTDNDLSGPWWEGTLNRSTRMSQILIYNRQDCCAERIVGFTLSILDGNDNALWSWTDTSGTQQSIYTIDTSASAPGSKVKVKLNRQDFLQMAEVVVIY